MRDAFPAADLPLYAPRRPRLRFTLSGMFIFTLGVSLALAFRRVPSASWADTILAACACWICVGVLQQLWTRCQLWRRNWGLPREVQWGFALDLMRQIGAILAIASAVAFELVRRFNPDPTPGDRDEFTFVWALEGLSSTLFFLGVIIAYWPKQDRAGPSQHGGKPLFRALLDAVAGVLGTVWLLYILANQTMITGLVHFAIRGVEVNQPTRWLGEPLYPANLHLELTRQFIARSIVASILIAMAFGVTILLSHCWNARRTKFACIVAAVLCLSSAAALAWWAWTVAYPTLSPYMSGNSHVQPLRNWLAGIALLLTASLALVCRVVPRPYWSDHVAHSPEKGPADLHFTLPVMVLFLVGALGGSAPEWWTSSLLEMLSGGPPAAAQSPAQYLSELIQFWTYEPKLAMRFAAIFLVGWHAWRRWRGRDAQKRLSAVNPVQLFLISLLAVSTLVIVIPVAAWLGFVLVVYSPLLGL